MYMNGRAGGRLPGWRWRVAIHGGWATFELDGGRGAVSSPMGPMGASATRSADTTIDVNNPKAGSWSSPSQVSWSGESRPDAPTPPRPPSTRSRSCSPAARLASSASMALRCATMGARAGEPGVIRARLTSRSRRVRSSSPTVSWLTSYLRSGTGEPGSVFLLGHYLGQLISQASRDRGLGLLEERHGGLELAPGARRPCRQNTSSQRRGMGLSEGGRRLRVIGSMATRWGSFRLSGNQVVRCDFGQPLGALTGDAWA